MTQLLDHLGHPIPPKARPETREIAAVSIRDRWSGYPSAGLTPSRLSAIFREADWGSLRNQAELFEEMEEKDANLASVMQTRRLAVLGLDFQIEDASESAEDKKIAEFCREALADLDLMELWTHLLGAVGQGYAGAEPIWENYPQARITRFNLIHPKNFNFVETLTPRIVTEDNWQGVEPPPFKLVFHKYAAKSGPAFRNGVLRVAGFLYLIKNIALKDWAVFNEIFGMPLRLGKYEPSASPADKEALRQAIVNLGSDAAGIISKATEIEFVEAATRLSGTMIPFQALADFCDRGMSKAVLGQTLSTDTAPGSGTLAGNAHAEVRRDLLEADAAALARTMRLQILRPLVGYNFGWDKPVPGCSFNLAEEEDLKALSETWKNLRTMGVEITEAQVHERFGIRPPQKGEKVIGAPVESAWDKVSRAAGEKDTAAMKAILPLAAGGLELIPQDAQVIQTHQQLENLTQAALAASAQAVLDFLAPVWDLIEKNEDLEVIKGKLLAVYPYLRPEETAQALYQAGMLAWMKARAAQNNQ